MLQALIQRLLTRVAFALGHCRWPWLKDRLIDTFVNHYPVNLLEARETNPYAYECFDAFFTRALKHQARSLTRAEPEDVSSPVDGILSEFGLIERGKIIQAKGFDYTVAELIGAEDLAAAYEGGTFITQYLAPVDYHRIHVPTEAQLIDVHYFPGQLHSVKPCCIASIPRLFAQNERAVARFRIAQGEMIMVLVAATLVSGLELRAVGTIEPGEAQVWRMEERALSYHQGEELGRFHFGSTVICLFTPHTAWEWMPLERDAHYQLYQPLARWRP